MAWLASGCEVPLRRDLARITMKESKNKIIKTCSAILISCIAAYGIVYAQQVCCSSIIDACIPTFKRISANCNNNGSCRITPLHSLDNLLQSGLCSKNLLDNFDAATTCCKTDRCDGYNQATVLSLSTIRIVHLFQSNNFSLDAGNVAPVTFQPYNLSTPCNTVPIYILTESIIC
jgi:hypothetical protein